MIDYKKLVPHPNLPLIVNTKYGIRKAILLPFVGFRFTDCTHPMQNCNLPSDYILGWEYQDSAHMEEGLFYVNKWQMQMDADEIIKKIKPLSWKEKFLNLLNL